MPEPLPPPTNNDRMNAALEYLDRGFSVIPVKRDKTPYLKWEEYQKRRPTEEEIERWWMTWPDANVAIITGKVSGIFAVDADGETGIDYMAKHLPKTSVYAKTANGVHAIYLIPENSVVGNRVRVSPEIDIRGDGGYIVASPSVHASGHVYQWIYPEGMDGWDGLIEYRPPSASIGAGNIGLDLSGIKTIPVNQPVEEGQRNDTLARLSGRWFSIGLDSQEVEALAKNWNQNNSPPMPDSELKRTIESIQKTHLKNHPAIDTSGLIADISPKKDLIFPEKLLSPGGMLSEVMDWIKTSSAVSVREFNLAGAIALIGTLAGQRFETESRLKTNFYVMALGHAGAGKDAPQSAVPAALSVSSEVNCIGPQTLTSDAALLKYVSNQDKARTLVFLDEIGLMMKAMKRPTSAAYELQSTLMKMFSGVNRKFIKPYANGDDLVVHWHHVSLYGASTPNHFWQSFTRSDATDGFLARILIFESHQDRVMSSRSIKFDVPDSLIRQINEFTKFAPPPRDTADKNLIFIPTPITVPKTQEADRYFTDWEQSIIDKQNAIQQKDEGIAAIYGRCPEHAHKLALVHAISIQGPHLRHVEMESVKWAIEMMDFQSEHIITQIRENISENDWHQYQQKILKAIRRYSSKERPGASIRDMYRFGIRVPEKTMTDLLQSLQSSGEIMKQIYKPSRGKDVDVYVLAKDEMCQ